MTLRRYQRELAAAAAWGLLLVAVAVVAPSFFQRGQPARPRAEQRAAAARGDRDDARDPRRPHRHLGRLAVRDRERVRRPAGQVGRRHAAAAPERARGRSRARRAERPARRAPRAAFDHRHARDTRGLARRPALGDRGRLGAGPAAALPVVRARPGERAAADRRRRARRAPGARVRAPPRRRRARRLRGRVGPRGRPARRHRARARHLLRVRADGRAHRARRLPERGALLRGAEQHRHRPRAQGRGRGRGRRHRDSRRPRHARRHPGGRGAAGDDRAGAHLRRHQPVLGESRPGRDHPGRARFATGCSDGWSGMPSPSPAEPLVRTRAPLRERLFPNGEWVLLLLLALECAALQRDRQQLPDRRQRDGGHPAGRRGRAARARP